MARWLTLFLSVACLLVANPESEDGKSAANTVEAAEFHDMRAEEIRAHITRWALIEATLPGTKNLRSLSEGFRFTNPEVLAIKEDPLRKPAIRQWTDGSVEVWTKPLRDGSTAVGIFNRGSTRRKLSVGWRDMGLTPPSFTYDVWARIHRRALPFGFPVELEGHSVRLLRTR